MKHHGKIKIKHAVKVLKVSRSGFYEYMHRRPSKQQVEREILSEKIKAVFHEHKGRYGAVRITKILHNTGIMTQHETCWETDALDGTLCQGKPL